MYNIYEELNKVIEKIEQHITEEINIDQLAKSIGLNSTTLKIVFSCLTGIGIHEYIRLRRLSLSANDILNGENVTQVAYKYLYNSPSSYNRAFKKYEGITPKELKKSNKEIKLFNKIVFQQNVTNDHILYKIYKNLKLDLYGISKKVDFQSRTKLIPKFWKEVKQNYPMFLEQTRYGFLTSDSVYYCLIKEEFPNSIKINLPQCNYFAIKVYSFKPENIIKEINKSLDKYIQSLNYKKSNLPNIEVYHHDHVEILIPIT